MSIYADNLACQHAAAQGYPTGGKVNFNGEEWQISRIQASMKAEGDPDILSDGGERADKHTILFLWQPGLRGEPFVMALSELKRSIAPPAAPEHYVIVGQMPECGCVYAACVYEPASKESRESVKRAVGEMIDSGMIVTTMTLKGFEAMGVALGCKYKMAGRPCVRNGNG